MSIFCCGTCHMASSFLPLPRMPTSTICSPSSLLVTTLTHRLALWSLSQTSAPLPNPLAEISHLARSAFLHLASHLKILAQVFMPEFDFWLGITLTHLAHLNKGANTSMTSSRVLYLSPRPEETNTSSGTSSPSIPDALLTSYAQSPSHFAGNSHHEQSQCSLMHITSSWGLEEFYCRN